MILPMVSTQCVAKVILSSNASYLVAFINKLVSPRNQFQSIHMIELGSDLVAKKPAGAARADSPRFNIFGI